METLIAFIIGALFMLALVIGVMRRARKRPGGKSSKAIEIMGGGGPGSGELPK